MPKPNRSSLIYASAGNPRCSRHLTRVVGRPFTCGDDGVEGAINQRIFTVLESRHFTDARGWVQTRNGLLPHESRREQPARRCCYSFTVLRAKNRLSSSTAMVMCREARQTAISRASIFRRRVLSLMLSRAAASWSLTASFSGFGIVRSQCFSAA